jgi:acyl-CoA dehydrogenase
MSFRDRRPDDITPLGKQVRRFVDEYVIPNESVLLRSNDQARRIKKELRAEARGQDLRALGIPKETGGGLRLVPYVYVDEVIGHSHFAMEALGTRIAQDRWKLYWFGALEQKEPCLLPMGRGEVNPCFSMTEAEVPGADPTSLRTTAVRHGDECAKVLGDVMDRAIQLHAALGVTEGYATGIHVPTSPCGPGLAWEE